MKPNNEHLSIGRLSKLTGVGVETLRFYEREGLVPKPPRRPSGYRQYPCEVVERIHFIQRAKELGFTLKEIKELLSLRVDSRQTCADIRNRAEIKIKDVKEKICRLRFIQDALQRLIKECTGKGPTSECPILENLQNRRKQ